MKNLPTTIPKFKDYEKEINFERGYSKEDFENDCELSEDIIGMVPEIERPIIFKHWVWIINNKDTDKERSQAWKSTIHPYYSTLPRLEKVKYTGIMIKIFGTKRFLRQIRKAFKGK